MKKWEQFEIDCTNYLKEHFGMCATFTHQGKSDSTIPDIKVNTKSGKQFYIEVKHCPAQCCQFVLLPNNEKKKFEYSDGNTSKINKFSLKIIEYMNNNFEEFKNAGTKGKKIDFEGCNEVFYKLIIKMYKVKGVKYFITNGNLILPIEKFPEYFSVIGKYRIKKSGTYKIPKKNIEKVSNYIKSNFSIIQTQKIDDRLFVFSNDNLDKKTFTIDNINYGIFKRDVNFEIRKLSNTFNPNVIFNIKLNKNKEGISVEDFKKILNNF